jgi:hypothetical protein
MNCRCSTLSERMAETGVDLRIYNAVVTETRVCRHC